MNMPLNLSNKTFILPPIVIRDSFDDDDSEHSLGFDKSYIKNFEQLYSYKNLLIAADPGNGKTQLLSEINQKANDNGFKSLFIDLKKVEKNSIETIIGILDESNEQQNSPFYLDKTSKDLLLCLDALDEVKSEFLFDTVMAIHKFKIAYPNIKIIISCRTYVYKRYVKILSSLELQLLEIKPFSTSQINQYLSTIGIDNVNIKKINDRFMRGYEMGIINSPRILEIFTELWDAKGEEVLTKSKAELLEEFIYKKLEKEDKSAEDSVKKSIELVKRVLEKLALTMEINQSNEITTDELMTFFDDIDSNLSKNFLNIFPISKLYNDSLLILSGNKVRFQNVEFQEYLAAKEITRFERTDQALFDLVVDHNISEIFISWGNTIRYLMELEPDNLLQVVKFITRKGKPLNSELLDLILIDDEKIISNKLKDAKVEIFTVIYIFYKSQNWYLGPVLIDKIPLYYTNELDKILKIDFENQAPEIALENTIAIVGRLLKLGELTDKNYWKEQLLTQIRKTTSDNVKTSLIKALAGFNDINLFKNEIEIKNLSNNARYELLNACKKIDPDAEFSIDQIINAIKKDNYGIYPKTTFGVVTKKDGIKYYLRKLVEDELLLSTLKVNTPDQYDLNLIYENITSNYDLEIEYLLDEIIFLPSSHIDYDKIIPDLLKIQLSTSENYLFKTIKRFKEKEDYPNNYVRYNQILEKIVTNENAEIFIAEMLKLNATQTGLISLLHWYYQNTTTESKLRVFEIGRYFFQTEYERIEKQRNEMREKNPLKHDLSLYEQFIDKLQPKPGYYSNDLFSFYTSNRAALKKSITPTDRYKIKDLIEKVILKFDFNTAKVKYTGEQTKKYTLSNMIVIFGDAILVMQDFGIDIETHKKKILEYMPFALNESKIKEVFSLLGELTQNELDYWFDLYSNPREDDAQIILVRNFFEVCKTYRFIAALPKLKEIVNDEKQEYYNRKQALEIIELLNSDFSFFQQTFEKYRYSKDKSDEMEICLTANQLLITKQNVYQRTAIEWRMQKVLSLITNLNSNKKYITNEEVRNRNHSLLNNLTSVSNPEYQGIYLNFLNESFKIYEKGKEYQVYGRQIWYTVIKYFSNLKIYNRYEPLFELEKVVQKNKDFIGYTLLNASIMGLKFDYSKLLGKPKTYTETVKIYNRIKATTYNEISTPKDFFFKVQQVIDEDINNWVTKEGAYKLIEKERNQETLIQKTLQTQFYNGLLRRGLRDCDVIREQQLINDKRTDFVIKYGFIGQILIEIKLCKNPETRDSEYEKTLLNYIDGTGSDYGIFLIFQTTKNPTWKNTEPKMKEIYNNHLESGKIKLMGYDCTKPIEMEKTNSKQNTKKRLKKKEL